MAEVVARRRAPAPAAAAAAVLLILSVALAGCGDSPTSAPEDVKEAPTSSTPSTSRKEGYMDALPPQSQPQVKDQKQADGASIGEPGQVTAGLKQKKTATLTGTATETSTTTSTTTEFDPNRTTTRTQTNTRRPVDKFGYLSSFRNCYLPSLLRQDLGCIKLETTQGGDYVLNHNSQDTTGKRLCLDRVRAWSANAFVFRLGQCEVWKCRDRDALRASTDPDAVIPPQAPTPATTPAPSQLPPEPTPTGPSTVVSFKSYHGKYLRVGADYALTANGEDASSPEARFIMAELVNEGKVLLWSSSGYVSAGNPANGGILRADKLQVSNTEKFILERWDDGRVSLKSLEGLYVTARPEGIALMITGDLLEWEKFTLVNHSAVGSPAPAGGHRRLGEHGAHKVSVYSDLCEFQEGTGGVGGKERRAPIIVKLWEWNFVDIARECKEYLGPNGFDAVQISPVVEHVRSPHWWAKYQPISFGLNSRSGTAEEFRSMVATCREAGVQVVVDLILNHIATPCPAAMVNGTDATPCVGWAGSRYGNRQIAGARGWDAATPEYFRHQPGEPLWGLCGVGAPSYLCGSLVTTDCSCCKCDLYGLPDWNTELQAVQEIHYQHIEELHDMGVTMLRIDAALYEDVGQVSRVLNRFPWDYIFMEWWGEYPVGIHDKYIGQYRDVAWSWKVANALAAEPDPSKLPELLDLTWGVFGIPPEKALYPIAFHDKRTNEINPAVATYKNGLEYHQQQKFFMVWPATVRISLWGGFSWSSIEDGPPGCDDGQETCTPLSVFAEDGSPDCMPTPTESPLPEGLAFERRWVCEHRWTGVAGLVAFRKACRGLPVARVPDDGLGRLAFRVGEECFVALVRGNNTMFPHSWGPVGTWNLAGLKVGLPPGRYCDVAALPARLSPGATSCPREVVVGSDGTVASGAVLEGDLLAIYTGGRLADAPQRRLQSPAPPRLRHPGGTR